jgi:AraC-like DNA-binding protein
VWFNEGSRHRLAHARERLADLEETVGIAEIAREAGLSPFHFIRRFEAVFGITPHQFRIDRRIERAKLLLASGRSSVTETCLEVGFSSMGTFSALFTRRVGETPSSYRGRMRVMVQASGSGPVLTPGCLNLLTQLPPFAFRNFREAEKQQTADH